MSTVVKVVTTRNTVVVQSNPTQVVVRSPGPPGPQGSAGSSYDHTQGSAATQWTINHNLNRLNVAVQSFDAAGNEIEGQVLQVSVNQVIIYFTAAIAGRARIT